jgi:hypothetical protein
MVLVKCEPMSNLNVGSALGITGSGLSLVGRRDKALSPGSSVRRAAGLLLLGVGLTLVGWMGMTLLWRAPFTFLSAHHEQQLLSTELAQIDHRALRDGDPVARIGIPKVHLGAARS